MHVQRRAQGGARCAHTIATTNVITVAATMAAVVFAATAAVAGDGDDDGVDDERNARAEEWRHQRARWARMLMARTHTVAPQAHTARRGGCLSRRLSLPAAGRVGPHPPSPLVGAGPLIRRTVPFRLGATRLTGRQNATRL